MVDPYAERRRLEIAEQRLREAEKAREGRERQRDDDRRARERLAQDKSQQSSDEREKQRQHDRDMYERKYLDRQNDEIDRSNAIVDAEREKSQRDLMLTRIDAELRERQVDVDFEDHVRRENIELQSHQHRVRTETDAELDRIRETASQARMDIMANLRAAVVQKFVDHTFETLKRREQAEMQEREMILGNELAKDFKSHETDELIRLRRALGHLTPDEFKSFVKQFEAEGDETMPPAQFGAPPGPTETKD